MNREKDRVNQQTQPKDTGEVKRTDLGQKEREWNGGTGADLSRKTGHPEYLDEQGGMMKNQNDRKDSDLRNTNLGDEPGRNTGSDSFGSTGGRRPGSMESESDISREEKSPGRTGSVGNPEGRH